MADFKVENMVFKGEFELPFCGKTVSKVRFDVKGTDEELTQMLVELQEKVLNNEKFLNDMNLYSAVKYAEQTVYMRDLVEWMNFGDRDETFSAENMQALEDYASSVNLLKGYEGYTGDVEGFVKKQFPGCDFDLITCDFQIDSIMINSRGGFSFVPEAEETEYDEEFDIEFPNMSAEIWQGDYVEFSAKLVGGVTSH